MPDVIINFVGKVDQLVPAENALDAVIAKEGEVGAAWKKTTDQANAQTKTTVENTNKLSKSIENLANSAKSMDKAVIGGAYSNYLKQIQKELGLTNKEIIAYIKNAKSAAQEMIITGATQQEVDELTLSIEVMNDQLKLYEGAGAAAETKTVSLRTRMKELKNELAAMAAAGQQGTDAYKKLFNEAAQLDDQIKDLNASISNAGSDTRALEGVVGIASGVSAGFSAAQGAIALFGGESEDVQKALLKVNAAMAITQGLLQIQTLLQKESAAAQLIQRIATVSQTTAQNLFTTATAGSTAAIRVFKTALVTTGVGAIVVALGFLVEKLMSATDAQEDFNGSIDDFLTLMDAELEGIETAGTKIDQALQKSGASQAARIKANGQNLVIQRNTIQREILRIENLGSSVERTEETNKKIADLYKKRDKLDLDINQKRIDYDKQVTEEAKAEADKRNAINEKERAIREKNEQAVFEVKQRALQSSISNDEKEMSSEDATYEQRLSALARFLFHKNELLNLQEAQEKSKRGLTAAEILNIEDDFNKKRDLLVEDGMNRRNNIFKTYNDRLFEQEKARAEQMGELFNEEVAMMNKSIEGVFTRISLKDSGKQDKELADLQELFDKGLIKLEDYEKQREVIRSKYERKAAENNISRLQTAIANNKLYGLSTVDLEKQLYDAKEALRQKDLADHKKANAEKVSDDEKAAAKRKEIEKQIKDAAFLIAKQALDAIFDINNQERENNLNKDLNTLNKRKEAELANKNLTEEQKAAIDLKYKKQEGELRRRAFEQDKIAKRSQALISAALAIIQAFAQLGPVAGAIAAGVIGVTTGIQIDKINRAEPPPAYRKGKVRIQGPGTETSDSITARLSKNESVITAKATNKWEGALLAMNNDTFEDWLSKAFSNFTAPVVPDHILPAAKEMAFDYIRMAEAIASRMPASATIHNEMNEDGITSFIIDKTSKVFIKNKRYDIG